MGFLFIRPEMVAGGDLVPLASWVLLSPCRTRIDQYAHLNGMYVLRIAGVTKLVAVWLILCGDLRLEQLLVRQ